MVSISTVALIEPCGMPSVAWAVDEDGVPQARLEVALQLRQVEVGAGAAAQQLLGVVEDVEAEVEQRARHRLAVDQHVLSGRCQPRGRTSSTAVLVVQLVGLAARRVARSRSGGGPRRARLIWPSTMVGPGGRGGVLEVGHEAGGAGVQRVDDHLAVDRAGDLDAAVEEVGRERRHLPVGRRGSPRSRGGSRAARRRRGAPGARRGAPAARARSGRKRRSRSTRNARASGVRTLSAPSTCGASICRPETE